MRASFSLTIASRAFSRLGVDDLTFYAVRRDQETIDAMVAKAVDFWTNHVLTDIPPDPETFDDLKFLYARDNGQAIEATDEILAQLAEFRELSDQAKRIEERRDELKFGIQTFMEPNAILTAKGEPVVTWKSQSARRAVVSAARRWGISARSPTAISSPASSL